jgi:biopolymer transport protein TolR
MQQPSAQGGFRSEINVTPLVDVCLVLLIIFMIVTPIIYRQIPVQLPETQTVEPPFDPHRQLVVSMLEDQTVEIEDQVFLLSELPAELRRLRAVDPDRPVFVQGDRRLRYEQLSLLLESLKDAGFREVGLVTLRVPSNKVASAQP